MRACNAVLHFHGWEERRGARQTLLPRCSTLAQGLPAAVGAGLQFASIHWCKSAWWVSTRQMIGKFGSGRHALTFFLSRKPRSC